MAKKDLLEKVDITTGERYQVFKGLPKRLLIDDKGEELYSYSPEKSMVRNGLLQVLRQLDISQNTGFRTIYNSMGYKSTELNRALYNAGTLCFFRSGTTGRIVYMRAVAKSFHDNGMPKELTAVPIFRIGDESGAGSRTFYLNDYMTDRDDIVLWHDTPPLQSTTASLTSSRAMLNAPFLDLSAKILQKMEKQLILSGTRLIGLAKDTSSIPVVKRQLQDLITEDDIVQVVSNILEVDTRVLSMDPELLGYMQILQELNQYRQYVNGFGAGQFGTFKKERLLTGEIEQNEGNTNLVHMARVAFDKEFVADMKRVFNEEIVIEYTGANMGGKF